ncbi:branched-chain amino acid ABC transporter substrate-binding protein [Paraburkholderia caribensis]|uniref:branched-chain amino acid ABC transporter substrate-binding protein n=1 Tax=Paraburkholderia caribensis TaxID=75105 RepID=UPI001CB02EA8|nr:branched-chain amino acid ABC transporter substrate-binding protein [Paraburkholderia caribensis]CAG9242147.1 Amino acid/amide ABC transporter substrate-binding protein, HAAT family [Paraburkholderia caribensis]
MKAFCRFTLFVGIASLSVYGESSLAQEKVSIGIGVPLTGPNASYGKDIVNGIDLAISNVNSTHPTIDGKSVQFVRDAQDDQADPKTAVAIAQKFADNQTPVVIGHFNSGATLPASKVYNSAGIPMLTPASTNPAVTQQGYENVFRLLANDDQDARAAADYAVRVLKVKRIAVLDDRTAFGQGEADIFAQNVEKLGGQVIDRQYTNSSAVDFSAQLTHIKASQAELIYFGGLDQQAALIAKRMKQLGMKAQLMTGGAVADDTFLSIAGPAAEGTMAWETSAPLNDKSGPGATYIENYKKQFNSGSITFSPYAYDAAMIVMKTMIKTGSTKGSDLVKSLKTIDYPGITGQISFDKNGDRKKSTCTLYQVKNGKWTVLALNSGS